MLTFCDNDNREEDYDNQEENKDIRKSKYIKEIRQQVVEVIDHFFFDKEYWADGQKIPRSKLYSEDSINTVLTMNVMDALAIAYYCLEKTPPRDTVDTSKKNWEIHLCLDCLKQCAARFIPKTYIGGILLVYLSMCHGINFISVIKKLEIIKSVISQKEEERSKRHG